MHERSPEDINDESPAASMEMPRYVSHKKVWALEIAEIHLTPPREDGVGEIPGPRRLVFRESGYAPMVAPGEMFSRYMPVAGDFYVVYADGYKSFSPRKAFLEGYSPESGQGRSVA